FSRSRSIESRTRSGTVSLARKMPLCQSIASTSVVFPWSTWAMMARLRRSGRVTMAMTFQSIIPMVDWARPRDQGIMRIPTWLLSWTIVAALPVALAGAQGKPMHPFAVITMEKVGEIRIELFPEDAPKTVESFVTLSKKGFYDGLVFHRVVRGFV